MAARVAGEVHQARFIRNQTEPPKSALFPTGLGFHLSTEAKVGL